MPGIPEVSIIIPTRALAERASLLRRAIASVLSQEGVRTTLIVVVNGSQWDHHLVRELGERTGIRLVRIDEHGIPNALAAGRAVVDTPFFSTLDDDDIYLPDALAIRVRALQENSGCNVVVTNGLVRDAGSEARHIRNMPAIERDPLEALSVGNWLLPGAWLCRTASMETAIFDEMPMFLECTYLAIHFSLRGQICFVDEPTVVWHKDTPNSESKSCEFLLGQEQALQRLLEMPIPESFRRLLLEQLSRTRLGVADFHASEGRLLPASRAYLRSLSSRGGWRNLPSAANLIWKAMRK